MTRTLIAAALLVAAAGRSQAQDKPQVVFETSAGNFTIELEPAKAPKTVESFLKFVDDGFYADTIFHRVIGPSPSKPKGFMIQGGGVTKDGKPKEGGRTTKNESGNGLSNQRGTLAMARTNDPDSASAQFFVNLTDNSFLDDAGGGYTTFGKVVEGMDTVDKISKMPIKPDRRGEASQPLEPVVVKSAKRKKA